MLQINEMFYTPEDQDELARILESFNGEQKSIAYLVAMQTWNLAAKIANKKLADMEPVSL